MYTASRLATAGDEYPANGNCIAGLATLVVDWQLGVGMDSGRKQLSMTKKQGRGYLDAGFAPVTGGFL